MKELVHKNTGEVFGVYIAEMGIFTADMVVVFVFFVAGLAVKDRSFRVPMWVGGALYLIFSLLWHAPIYS